MQRLTIERGNPLSTYILRKPQMNGFHELIPLLQGGVKTCFLDVKVIHILVKVNTWEH